MNGNNSQEVIEWYVGYVHGTPKLQIHTITYADSVNNQFWLLVTLMVSIIYLWFLVTPKVRRQYPLLSIN